MLFLGNYRAETHHDVELAGDDQRLDPGAPLGLDPHQHLVRPHRSVGPGDSAGRPSPCLESQCGRVGVGRGPQWRASGDRGAEDVNVSDGL